MSIRAILGAIATATVLCSCGGGGGITFFGRVYDGVTGVRLVTDYSLELQYGYTNINGSIEDDGHFVVGPLDYFSDYTVIIKASDYRPFLSHNAMPLTVFPSDAEYAGSRSRQLYYDAYLFPVAVEAPAVAFTVSLAGSQDRPAGMIRLSPTLVAPTSTSASALEVAPAGVPNQVWGNDEDLQVASVVKEFTNGTIAFGRGELVYGVNYAVRVYNIVGHKDITGTHLAGSKENTSFVAVTLDDDPLAVSFMTTELGALLNYEVVIVMNQPIEFDELTEPVIYREAIDDAFSINSPDADGDLVLNTLPADVDANTQERGTEIIISDNRLTLRWTQTTLATTDGGDDILSITFAGLLQVRLRPVNGVASQVQTLSALVGAPSITVQTSQ